MDFGVDVNNKGLNCFNSQARADSGWDAYSIPDSMKALYNDWRTPKTRTYHFIINPKDTTRCAQPLPKAVNDNKTTLPYQFSLSQNYPNPFNESTIIEFEIPEDGNVELTVFNILGEKVSSSHWDNMNAGKYRITFNTCYLSTGLYFYRLKAGNNSDVKKMMLIK